MRQFTKKIALAFGATLLAAGLNTTKAQAGAALNFDATGPADKVALPQAISTNSLVGGTKITVEAWVRPTTLTGLGVIVGNYANPNNALQFLLRRDNNTFAFFVGNGTSVYNGLVTAAGTATINTWQHVAGVFDGTVISVYINGVFSSSVNATSNYTFATTSNSIVVGTNGAGSPESFSGDIDELRIWKTNRSRCEINTFMNCEIPTNASNLVANYHFNQGIAAANNATVTSLNDATSNAFNGTLSNFALTGATGNWVTPGGVVSGFTTALAQPTLAISPSANISTCLNNTVMLTASGASTYSWSGGVTNAVAFTASATTAYTVNATAANGCTAVPAVASITANNCPGAALSFDGVNDFVDCGMAVTNVLKGLDKMTVEAWIYPTQNTAGKSVIGNHGSNTQFNIQQTTNNQITFFIGFGTYAVTTPVNSIQLNTWQHVAGVFDDNVIRVYINGVFSGSTAVPNTYVLDVNGNTPLMIGKSGFGEEFRGYLDEVRVWSSARTQCDINTFRNCEIPANAANLLVNYHLNQGTAFANNSTVTIANDATSNATNGTLTNFALTLGSNNSNWVAPGGVASGFTTALAPPSLTVTANSSLSTCLNNTISLTASGASTYTWSGGVTNAVAFTATASTVYTVTATAANSCTNTAVASVTTNNCPGEALSLDGVNDFVDCGMAVTNALKGKDKMTVEAWIYPTQNTAGKSVIGNHSSNTQFNIQQTTNNQVSFFIGFGTYAVTTPVNSIQLNTWQHVAGVFDDNVIKVYINGVLSGTTAVPNTYVLDINCNINLWIGKSGFGGEEFKGRVDEVRVWDIARTQCEINTFKNCEIPTNATNLLVNYHFNQGSAFANNSTVTIANDATSSATNGTLTNFALSAGSNNSNWVAPGAVAAGFTTALAAPGYTNSILAICPGGTVSLGSTNTTSYTWTPSITNNTPFTPTASTTYSYVGTNSVSTCSTSAAINVTVNPSPTVTAVTSETNVLCVGQSATLTAGGATSYVWNTTATTAVIAISPSVTTSYTVTGTDGNGCTNVATVTQNVSACTGITANSTDVNLEIYPNPSNGIFNIKASSSVSIEVFNVLGNLILKTNINAGDYKLNLGEQNKGLYIVKCTSQGQVKSYRLIKD